MSRKFTGTMSQQTASYIFELDIHDFKTPTKLKREKIGPSFFDPLNASTDEDSFILEALGTREFEICLGDNTTKWKFDCRTCNDRLFIDIKKKHSDSNNFSVRAAHLVAFNDEKPYFFDYVTGSEGKLDDSFELPYDIMNKNRPGNEKSMLKIFIKLELIEGSFPKEINRYVKSMSSKIKKLYMSDDFCDFTIVCSDKREFRVHRNILAVNSDVLKAMMLTNMQESIENKLVVKDIDGNAMNKILMFMYTHKIDDISDNIEGLLYGAEKYQMDDLKGLCIGHMYSELCVGTAVKFFMMAHFYVVDHLMQLCLMYIQFYHEDLRKTDEWADLSTDQLELIQQHVNDFEARPVNTFHMREYFWQHNF